MGAHHADARLRRGWRYRRRSGLPPSAITRNPGAFQRFYRVGAAVICGTPTPVTIRVVQMGRADTDFHRALQPASASARRALRQWRPVAADDLQVRMTQHGFHGYVAGTRFGDRERSINQNVSACRHQRVNALFCPRLRRPPRRHVNGPAHLYRVWFLRFTFWKSFAGNHAKRRWKLSSKSDQRFFLRRFRAFCQHDFTGLRAFTNSHQTLFRRRMNAYRLVQVGHKTHVTTGDDTTSSLSSVTTG